QSRAWAGSGHGRRCSNDYSGRQVSTLAEITRSTLKLRRFFQVRDKAREQAAPVGAAHDVFDVVLRVRHHTEHIAALADDASDGMRGTVEIGGLVDLTFRRAVAIEYAPLTFQPLQCLFVGLVIAFAMSDRHADHLSRIVPAR